MYDRVSRVSACGSAQLPASLLFTFGTRSYWAAGGRNASRERSGKPMHMFQADIVVAVKKQARVGWLYSITA
jgi:hypothetical protein